MALVLTGVGCGSSTAEKEAAKPVTLKVWRVFDEAENLQPAMDAYRRLHPNVSFDYRILRFDEYEDQLLRAFARGEGPDVFSIHNTWMGEYVDAQLITPLPAVLKIPYTETKGTIKKEKVITVREEKTISARELKNIFVDTISADVVRPYRSSKDAPTESAIFGLPLSVDTLALFYNRDLLNAAGIAEPPADWKTFQEDVKMLTRVDEKGVVLQSGAALGTASNVERASDILSVLMMQNGTPMAGEGEATFAETTEDGLPGADALRFYTDFANPAKEVYAWNADQPPSFEAFTSGKTAFFFGYAYHLSQIRTAAPKLNLGVAALPQIADGRTVNFANYWVETASKAGKNTKWAWDFIRFATEAKQGEAYMLKAKRPPARRGLINKAVEDPELGVFANQLLTSKSWYRGKDASVVEEAFSSLIKEALEGKELGESLGKAQNKVNQTY